MPIVIEGFKPITAPSPASRSRIRLSSGLINSVSWESFKANFDCYGLFRGSEELLCAPTELVDDQGAHPFAEVLSIVEAVSTAPRVPALRAASQASACFWQAHPVQGNLDYRSFAT